MTHDPTPAGPAAAPQLTVDRRPYLGFITEGLVAAMGCNGYSAMASDEQGRIAATLALTGQVPDGYDAAELAVRTVAA